MYVPRTKTKKGVVMIKKTAVAVLITVLNYSIFIAASAAASSNEFRGPVSVKGKAFVDAHGKRFMVRGVAVANSKDASDDHVYDMLTDDNFSEEFEKKILPRLKELNVNTIRVYNIDPTKSHDKAMKALENAGIYLTLELASPKPGENINRITPKYTLSLYQRYIAVIDAMSKYENTLNFSLGNEVVFPGLILSEVAAKCNPSKGGDQEAAGCVDLANDAIKGDAAVLKSLARDMKAYMKSKAKTKGYREIPVGVAMQDTPSSQWKGLTTTSTVAQYYACGKSPSQRLDYVALNAYRYTNESTNVAQYMGILEDYHLDKMPVPFYLSETGGGNRPSASVERDWAIISWNYGLLGNLASPGTEEIARKYVDNLSGEIAFMLLNWKEKAGLYDLDRIAGREIPFEGMTDFGGAKKLAKQFEAVKAIDLPFPSGPQTIACPDNFEPPLLPNPASGTKISVRIDKNFKEKGIVVQSGTVIKHLENKDKVEVEVLKDKEMLLQTSAPNYFTVCKVPQNSLREGDTISDPAKEWGGNCLINDK
ncbi:MAG: hypothetical protein K0R08_383 [Solimicrobium sp.]|jgi:hypothetical protein|nr:hypothetical protein [Solimicrobium sp.]